MKQLFICLLVCGSVTTTAAAQPSCRNPDTQNEMNQCSSLEMEAADRQINATYADLRKRLSPERKERLKQVQLAWIKFKEQNCELESLAAEGGSMQPLLRNTCLTSMTKERNKQLRDMKGMITE